MKLYEENNLQLFLRLFNLFPLPKDNKRKLCKVNRLEGDESAGKAGNCLAETVIYSCLLMLFQWLNPGTLRSPFIQKKQIDSKNILLEPLRFCLRFKVGGRVNDLSGKGWVNLVFLSIGHDAKRNVVHLWIFLNRYLWRVEKGWCTSLAFRRKANIQSLSASH